MGGAGFRIKILGLGVFLTAFFRGFCREPQGRQVSLAPARMKIPDRELDPSIFKVQAVVNPRRLEHGFRMENDVPTFWLLLYFYHCCQHCSLHFVRVVPLSLRSAPLNLSQALTFLATPSHLHPHEHHLHRVARQGGLRV